jgi:hypothetical protein
MGWMDYGHNQIAPTDYAVHVYYSSFDELLPGVAIALLKNFHGDLYAKIMRKGNLLFVRR